MRNQPRVTRFNNTDGPSAVKGPTSKVAERFSALAAQSSEYLTNCNSEPRILLLSPDESSAEVLAAFLEQRHYHVTVHRERHSAGDGHAPHLDDFDVIVVDMTANRPEDWDRLDRACVGAERTASKPGILCLSRVYRGPQFELDIERRGGRLAYVR